jgi:hypothetical protein
VQGLKRRDIDLRCVSAATAVAAVTTERGGMRYPRRRRLRRSAARARVRSVCDECRGIRRGREQCRAVSTGDARYFDGRFIGSFPI